jgi:uncharacterized protein YeaO (DUF488 family)
MEVGIKSILLPASLSDGLRVFVERRWPRSIPEKAARVDLWFPEIAFSPQLSQWMQTHPEHAAALRKRYFLLLREPAAEAALEKLYTVALRRKRVTLLHAGKQGGNTAASMLKTLMEGDRKPPSPTGPAKAVAARGRIAKGRPRKR